MMIILDKVEISEYFGLQVNLSLKIRADRIEKEFQRLNENKYGQIFNFFLRADKKVYKNTTKKEKSYMDPNTLF